jgi:hypothetical protein
MIKGTKLGICMDHASARLMDCSDDDVETTVAESAFTHQVKESMLSRGEHQMHNKEQQEQGDFYKRLGDVIKHYDAVLLFGPTEAKAELFNLLKEDHHFDNIKIEVQNTDKMTENQEHAFVKAYFSK